MTFSVIMLRCDKCKREKNYPRRIDPNIPATVAAIISTCDLCDEGDFGTEVWVGANGVEVSQL